MKEFLKKFIGFSIGPVVGAIISFITVPIISHIVPADQIGLSNMFVLANSIITLVVLFGIDQAFIREFNEIEDKKKLLYNSIIIPLLISIIIGIVIVIFKEKLAILLFDDPTSIWPIILLALCTPVFIIEKFMLLILRMQEKAFQYSAWNIILKLLNLVLVIILLLYYKKNFESIIIATVFSELIISIILIIVCRRYIKISFRYFDKNIVNGLIKFGMPLVPASLISWGLSSMDSIFLRSMNTYTEVGYYGVSMKVVNVLSLIQSSFTAFWSPIAFKWHAKGESKEKFELVGSGVSMVMSLILVLILLFKKLIPIIFGQGYDVIIYIIPFLMFHPIFYTMSETTIMGIYFSKKTYYNIIISFVSMVSNLILNFLLVPKYAAVGASIATGMSYLVFFWMRTMISRKLWFKFDIKKYVQISFLLMVICLLNCIIKNTLFITIMNLIALVLVLLIYNSVLKKLVEYIKNSRSSKKLKA